MPYDGSDIKYLLEKRGYSLSDIAEQLGGSPQNVCNVIWGRCTSKPVLRHIEKLLNMAPGSLEISTEKTDAVIKVA